jgi:(p)ppGpp synthase/HD superfamily hydrolase
MWPDIHRCRADPQPAHPSPAVLGNAALLNMSTEGFEMSSLERAIAIAAEAHSGQTDKAGAPYILHPLRVMLALDGRQQQIAGVLHDICEDCPGWTLERLRAEGFEPAILSALDAVTKRDGESYMDFVRRAAADNIGRAVKLADLADNMDLSRIAQPTPKDFERVQKYRQAVAMISAMPD